MISSGGWVGRAEWEDWARPEAPTTERLEGDGEPSKEDWEGGASEAGRIGQCEIVKATWKRCFRKGEVVSCAKLSWDVELDERWELATGAGKMEVVGELDWSRFIAALRWKNWSEGVQRELELAKQTVTTVTPSSSFVIILPTTL